MKDAPYQRELTLALAAAEAAGREVAGQYEQFKAIPDAPASITTDADRAAQEIVLQTIRATFPGDALCAEEETPALAGAARTGDRLWVVDPIDGTRGFARKNGEFSVMVGFVERGRVVVGVVLEPARALTTYAIRNGGCWRRRGTEEPVACHVNPVADLAQATLTQSHSRNPTQPSALVKALAPGRVRESYSAGVKLAMVARGEADVYLNTYDQFHDWDICAGDLLVTEAGGTVTGTGGQTLVYGGEGAWQRHGLLATNGRLHAEALKRIASVASSR